MFAKQVSAKSTSEAEIENEKRREERKEEVKTAKSEVNEVQNGENGKEGGVQKITRAKGERKRSSRPNPRLSNPPNNVHGEQVAAGWPSWLSKVAGEAINGLTPRRADTFDKLDKVCLQWLLMLFPF